MRGAEGGVQGWWEWCILVHSLIAILMAAWDDSIPYGVSSFQALTLFYTKDARVEPLIYNTTISQRNSSISTVQISFPDSRTFATHRRSHPFTPSHSSPCPLADLSTEQHPQNIEPLLESARALKQIIHNQQHRGSKAILYYHYNLYF